MGVVTGPVVLSGHTRVEREREEVAYRWRGVGRVRDLCVRDLYVRDLCVRDLCLRDLCVRDLCLWDLCVRDLYVRDLSPGPVYPDLCVPT